MQPMILQSDFGYADGAVCAMYGVAENVCPELRVFDLTHDIPQYDIWEASYRLIQTVSYWPEGQCVRQRGGSRRGFHAALHRGAHPDGPVRDHSRQRHPDACQAHLRHCTGSA